MEHDHAFVTVGSILCQLRRRQPLAVAAAVLYDPVPAAQIHPDPVQNPVHEVLQNPVHQDPFPNPDQNPAQIPAQNPVHQDLQDPVLLEPVWNNRALFITFPDRNVTLSAQEIAFHLNGKFDDSVTRVIIRQDSKGYKYCKVLLKPGIDATMILGDLPSIFLNVKGRWMKVRKFFNKFPPY